MARYYSSSRKGAPGRRASHALLTTKPPTHSPCKRASERAGRSVDCLMGRQVCHSPGKQPQKQTRPHNVLLLIFAPIIQSGTLDRHYAQAMEAAFSLPIVPQPMSNVGTEEALDGRPPSPEQSFGHSTLLYLRKVVFPLNERTFGTSILSKRDSRTLSAAGTFSRCFSSSELSLRLKLTPLNHLSVCR